MFRHVRRIAVVGCLLQVLLLLNPSPAAAASYNKETIIISAGATCYSRAYANVTRSGTTRTVDWLTSSRCSRAVPSLSSTSQVINLLTTVQGPDTSGVANYTYVERRGTYSLNSAAIVTIQNSLHVTDVTRGPWVPVTCEGGRPFQMLAPVSDGDCIATVTFNTDW